MLFTTAIESSVCLYMPVYLLVPASEESMYFLSMTPNNFFSKHPASRDPPLSWHWSLTYSFIFREGALKKGKLCSFSCVVPMNWSVSRLDFSIYKMVIIFCSKDHSCDLIAHCLYIISGEKYIFRKKSVFTLSTICWKYQVANAETASCLANFNDPEAQVSCSW